MRRRCSEDTCRCPLVQQRCALRARRLPLGLDGVPQRTALGLEFEALRLDFQVLLDGAHPLCLEFHQPRARCKLLGLSLAIQHLNLPVNVLRRACKAGARLVERVEVCAPQVRAMLLQKLEVAEARRLMLELGLRVLHCSSPRLWITLHPGRRRVERVARSVHLGHWLLVAHSHPLGLEQWMVLKRRLVHRPALQVVARRTEGAHLCLDQCVDALLHLRVVVLRVDVG
mmetsp:Transcript_7162/g.14640  ORF Transcript_7162/g.14640 Transcript_7162/m.14640 type:complete len:228 (+) Transcript_7162:313-996(+)